MQVLTRSFSERNATRLGAVGVLIVVLLIAAALNLREISGWFTQNSYTAEFAESGNLAEGDEVRLSGVKIGQVNKVRLEHEHVAVDFSIRPAGTLGADTRAAIQTATVLGTRYLALMPAGPGRLEPGALIPLARTDSPYDLSEILSTLSTKSEGLDKARLAKALDVISTETAATPAPLRSALMGVSRLSETIGSRDTTLRELLTHTQAFTDTLAQRSGDIITIVSEGNNLLAELDARRQAIRDLLVNVTRVANELQGVVRDNEAEIGPALDQLNAVISMLKKDDEAIAASIHGLNLYAGSLGEIAHGAPYFMATVQNIAAPTNLIPGLPLGGQAGQPASPPSTGNGPGLPLLGGAGTGVGGPTR